MALVTELALSVLHFVGRPDWQATKASTTINVVVGEEIVTVGLTHQHTPCGQLLRLQCPICRARRRDLWVKDGRLGCRVCFKIRTGVPGTQWNRDITRPARMVQRIDEKLRMPMAWNRRRQLLRQRARLLRQIETALAARRRRAVEKVESASQKGRLANSPTAGTSCR
jgi:hypothetical protein